MSALEKVSVYAALLLGILGIVAAVVGVVLLFCWEPGLATLAFLTSATLFTVAGLIFMILVLVG